VTRELSVSLCVFRAPLHLKKSADKIFKRLSKLGYKETHQGQQIWLYPVLYGGYATYAEADKTRKIQKTDSQEPGAFESL
jgi:hypothetical protein